MTGTAKTEEHEFIKIYGMPVIVVPTNLPMIRDDKSDLVYKDQQEKFKAVIKEVKNAYERGQPVLLGTRSIEISEMLGMKLTENGVPHSVLNAKHHEKEAEIIAKAGQKKTVTIATNMAGRGTDIVLGEGVKELGGLYVLGTERHESRRIDNQLRGRSGRQGDQGTSRFYVSLDDELMRLFGGQRVSKMMDFLNIPADMPIEHRMISKAIERAQKKVEEFHFGIRKQVLQFDDVMTRQRESVYSLRRRLLEDLHIANTEVAIPLLETGVETVVRCLKELSQKKSFSEVLEFAKPEIEKTFPNLSDELWAIKNESDFITAFKSMLIPSLRAKEQEITQKMFQEVVRVIMLQLLDQKWTDHLQVLDHLREGIGLRAYGQVDPLIEYQVEGFKMFQGLLVDFYLESMSMILRAQVTTEEALELKEHFRAEEFKHDELQLKQEVSQVKVSEDQPEKKWGAPQPEEGQAVKTIVKEKKVGRNEPCPCGSGKKYKKCCGV